MFQVVGPGHQLLFTEAGAISEITSEIISDITSEIIAKGIAETIAEAISKVHFLVVGHETLCPKWYFADHFGDDLRSDLQSDVRSDVQNCTTKLA